MGTETLAAIVSAGERADNDGPCLTPGFLALASRALIQQISLRRRIDARLFDRPLHIFWLGSNTAQPAKCLGIISRPNKCGHNDYGADPNQQISKEMARRLVVVSIQPSMHRRGVPCFDIVKSFGRGFISPFSENCHRVLKMTAWKPRVCIILTTNFRRVPLDESFVGTNGLVLYWATLC